MDLRDVIKILHLDVKSIMNIGYELGSYTQMQVNRLNHRVNEKFLKMRENKKHGTRWEIGADHVAFS